MCLHFDRTPWTPLLCVETLSYRILSSQVVVEGDVWRFKDTKVLTKFGQNGGIFFELPPPTTGCLEDWSNVINGQLFFKMETVTPLDEFCLVWNQRKTYFRIEHYILPSPTTSNAKKSRKVMKKIHFPDIKFGSETQISLEPPSSLSWDECKTRRITQ